MQFDAAESAWKLCSDFLGVAKSESRFQDYIQGKENCRKTKITRNRKHDSQKWWLELIFKYNNYTFTIVLVSFIVAAQSKCKFNKNLVVSL